MWTFSASNYATRYTYCMKKLKLDHKSAQLVLAGIKTTTWRLFDDKDLAINDRIELIDKVESTNPASWRVIGEAIITSIVEKRLSEVTNQDMQAGEGFSSRQEMLDLYRAHYGDHVTMDNVVKIIAFHFTSESEGVAGVRNVESIKLYADGGSRGNPGPSAAGFVITDDRGDVLVDRGLYLGITTNNQAEYQALKFGLEEALKMSVTHVAVYMDSLLVVNQMKGIFKVKNRDLWPIHEAIMHATRSFQRVSFTHIPRELNKLADAAVNRVLDEQVSARKNTA